MNGFPKINSPSYLVPLFQDESSDKPFSYENGFDLHENEPAHFHMNGFVETPFDTEAKDYSEMTWEKHYNDVCEDRLSDSEMYRAEYQTFLSQSNKRGKWNMYL